MIISEMKSSQTEQESRSDPVIDRRPRRGVHLSDPVHTHGLMLRPSALRAVARRSGILRSVASPRSMSSLVPDTLKDMASDTGDSEGVEMSLQKLRKQGQPPCRRSAVPQPTVRAGGRPEGRASCLHGRYSPASVPHSPAASRRGPPKESPRPLGHALAIVAPCRAARRLAAHLRGRPRQQRGESGRLACGERSGRRAASCGCAWRPRRTVACGYAPAHGPAVAVAAPWRPVRALAARVSGPARLLHLWDEGKGGRKKARAARGGRPARGACH